MKILYFLVITIFVCFSSYAQEVLSVHAAHKKEFGNLPVMKSLFDESGKGITPLKYDKSKLSASVYGYLPYWEYSGAKSQLQYDLLTHIGLFDFEMESSDSRIGYYKNPSYWPWTDVINTAHTNGVQVQMVVTNFNLSATQFHRLITTDSIKQIFFTNIKNTIQAYNLDGVNIDFEGLASADRGALINTFMTDLTNFIHTNLPGREVSYAGPIINWGGWDLPGLAKACDYIFIMGYDFSGSWSTTTDATAPLASGTYNITSGLTSSSFGYGGALGSYSNKLILGVPYFGKQWTTKTNAAHDKVEKYIKSTYFKSDMPNALIYGLQWDSKSQTPWYYYKQDSLYVQTWFDNDSSLEMKYDLAKSKNLKGVGMWALGQDGSRTELWNLLRKKYLVDVKSDKNYIPSGFSLGQNYPNPFNPATNIKFEIPYSCNVSLKVYDLLGRQAATLVDEVKPAGSYTVELNSKLASGVYYYTLKAGSFTQSKKMTVLK